MTLQKVGSFELYLRYFTFIFYRKDVTKPRNKTKEFLFNLVFFLILPFLLLLKLCKKIKRLRKDHASKKKTKTQDKGEEEDDIKGPEVEIFKEGSILKDGRLRTDSELSSGYPDVKRGSKESMSGIKRRQSSTSGKEDNIATSGTPQGSKHKMAAQGSRHSSKETVGEPSTSSRDTGQDKVQVTTNSHSNTNISVDQRTAPSPPQVGNVLVSMFL